MDFILKQFENEPLQFRIKIPYLWEKKNVFDNLPLLKNIFNPPIDQPKALEELVQNRIHFLASYLLKEPYILLSQKFEFLSNTAIANDHLPRLKLLKMKTKASRDTRNQVFHGDVQILATESVLVQPTPKSSLPDLITVVALSKKSRYYIGWQMKNYPRSELKVGQLQNELCKFTDILLTNCRAAVFVIVVNGKADNIVNKYRGQVISSTDTDAMKELQIECNSLFLQKIN